MPIALAGALSGPVPAALAQDTGHRLAMDHRPLLRFDREERWRPLEIDAFLGESLGSVRAHRLCPTGVEPCQPVGRARELTGGPGAVLDIAGERREGRDYATPLPGGCRRPSGVVDCDTGRRTALYYRFDRSGGRTVIDYWWFFRFNDFPYADLLKCTTKLVCDDHEGDWEGVRVIVTPGRTRPEVRFDAHGRSERYSRAAAELRDGRPVVYVALGTHAAYPRPCVRKYCTQTGDELPEGRFDGDRDWGRNSDAACARTCLLPLPVGGWSTWPGLWGRACRTLTCRRTPGPLSPGRQRRTKVATSARREFGGVSLGEAVRMVVRHGRDGL